MIKLANKIALASILGSGLEKQASLFNNDGPDDVETALSIAGLTGLGIGGAPGVANTIENKLQSRSGRLDSTNARLMKALDEMTPQSQAYLTELQKNELINGNSELKRLQSKLNKAVNAKKLLAGKTGDALKFLRKHTLKFGVPGLALATAAGVGNIAHNLAKD